MNKVWSLVILWVAVYSYCVLIIQRLTSRKSLGGDAMSIGIWELVLILIIAALLFGVGRLPQLGSALGEAIKNFRKAAGMGDSDKPK